MKEREADDEEQDTNYGMRTAVHDSFSCEHKDLCYHHPHVAVVKLEFDWKNAPQANPEGMCVFFYPEEGENRYVSTLRERRAER